MLPYELNIYKAIKNSVYNLFYDIKSSCCNFWNNSKINTKKEKID